MWGKHVHKPFLTFKRKNHNRTGVGDGDAKIASSVMTFSHVPSVTYNAHQNLTCPMDQNGCLSEDEAKLISQHQPSQWVKATQSTASLYKTSLNQSKLLSNVFTDLILWFSDLRGAELNKSLSLKKIFILLRKFKFKCFWLFLMHFDFSSILCLRKALTFTFQTWQRLYPCVMG